MMRTAKRVVAIGLTLLATTTASALADGKPGLGGHRATVHLVASVDAVTRGAAFDVALHFELAEGWHIYWRNPGDSGLPPSVQWSLPPGFEAGELRFPVPRREVSPGGIVTNILEGSPVLPVTITPPASIDGEPISLGADVRYLICRENCIRKTAKLALTLPVRTSGTGGPANESLFRRAARTLPKTTSKYLTIRAVTKPTRPSPGAPFELVLNVRIKPGYHVQSNKPLNESFIASDVFLDAADGVTFHDPVYPPPKFRTLKYVGRVSEFVGNVTIRIPGEVDPKADKRAARLGGLLRYQACNDKGTCFPPEALRFSVSFNSADASATAPEAAVAAKPSSGDGERVVPLRTEVDVPVAGESASAARPESSEADSVAEAEGGGLEAWLGRLGVPGQLIVCFLYGLLINATPCVLPLLSIKVLGFAQQAHESRRRTLMLGLSFGLGVMVFFVLLGLLAARGTNILQYPRAVIALGAVVMVMALSMLGVFTLQAPSAATKLEATITQEGLGASFGKGALAPVLGFACTAPMMAGGFAWATKQPSNLAVLAFLFMGLGMASPYMLLGANPQWLRFLPKPGNWMITFERIVGFALLAMVVWLIHPLTAQIGATGLEWTIVFLIAVASACWLLGQVQVTQPDATRWKLRGGAAAIALVSGLVVYGWAYPIDKGRAEAARLARVRTGAMDPNDWSAHIPWRRWSPSAVRDVVMSGRPVFVDFTAAYCTVCKANKGMAIETPEARDKMRACGVVPFRGDFTNGDDRVFEMLQRYDRAGVPLNLIYRPRRPDKPIVLRTNLTKSYLLAKLDEACPVRSASAVEPTP